VRVERIKRQTCAFCPAEATLNVGGILLGTTICGGTNVCAAHELSVEVQTVAAPAKFLNKPTP